MRVKDQTKSQSLDWTMLHQDLSLLMDSFEKFLKEHREMLGLKLSDDESMLELSYPMMSKLYEKLKPQITSDLSFEIAHSWFYNPISEYLKVFPSYVEELSERLSKKIFPLKFNGDQLKIKRGYYDDLFLSLIHLIRNATDHGIESPEERVGKGKLAHGQIQFNFKEEGRDSSHTLIIEIEDDGKGLDLEKILKNDFVKLNPEQQELAVIKKLFYEGISTKTEVTDISGQGAGLAAVGLVMTKLKGKISIDLNKKVGTKFILKVPYV
jgi:two-component system chemotaxis sensor kinase CheA